MVRPVIKLMFVSVLDELDVLEELAILTVSSGAAEAATGSDETVFCLGFMEILIAINTHILFTFRIRKNILCYMDKDMFMLMPTHIIAELFIVARNVQYVSR